MILLPCPWCGPRNVSEFAHLGEMTARPDPQAVTPAQWRDYLYFRANPRGWVTETWFHRAGCRRYVTVERDTASNAVRPSAADAARSGAERREQAGGVDS